MQRIRKNLNLRVNTSKLWKLKINLEFNLNFLYFKLFTFQFAFLFNFILCDSVNFYIILNQNYSFIKSN